MSSVIIKWLSFHILLLFLASCGGNSITQTANNEELDVPFSDDTSSGSGSSFHPGDSDSGDSNGDDNSGDSGEGGIAGSAEQVAYEHDTEPDILTSVDIPRITNHNIKPTVMHSLYANSANKSYTKLPIFNRVPPVISGFSIIEGAGVDSFKISISSYGSLKDVKSGKYKKISFRLSSAEYRRSMYITIREYDGKNMAVLTGYWAPIDRNVSIETTNFDDLKLYPDGPSLEITTIKFKIDKNRANIIPKASKLNISARYNGILMPFVGLEAVGVAEKFGSKYTDYTNSYPYKEISKEWFQDEIGNIKLYKYISPTHTLTTISLCPQSNADSRNACISSYNNLGEEADYLHNLPEANLYGGRCNNDQIYYDNNGSSTCVEKRIAAAKQFNPFVVSQHSYLQSKKSVLLNFDVMSLAPINGTEIQVAFFDELFRQIGDPIDIKQSSISKVGTGDYVFSSYTNAVTNHRIRVTQEYEFTNKQLDKLFPYVYLAVYVRHKDVQSHLSYNGNDFSSSYFFTQYGAMLPENMHKSVSLVQIDSSMNGGAARVNNKHINDYLIVQYLFSDNFNDTSGNNHHAKAQGSVDFISDRFGKANNAIRFNGKENYLTSGKSLFNNLQTFTMEGWFKPESLSAKRTGLFGQNDAVELGLYNDNIIQAWSATHTALNSSNSLVKLDKWNHIAIVGSHGRFSIYINGELANSVIKKSIRFSGSSYSFNIGGAVFDSESSSSESFLSGAKKFFKGGIDDVSLYSIAFSAELIKQRYKEIFKK